MTIDQLRSYAESISNVHWTRYWLHWNYPQRTPWNMAISARTFSGGSAPIDVEMLEKGFVKVLEEDLVFWVIRRTNEDGSYYG